MLTLQKLPAGKRRDLTKKHLITKMVGSQIQANMDMPSFQIGILSRVIIKAPFEVSEQILEAFPDDVVDYLFKEYSDWTGDSKKKVD